MIKELRQETEEVVQLETNDQSGCPETYEAPDRGQDGHWEAAGELPTRLIYGGERYMAGTDANFSRLAEGYGPAPRDGPHRRPGLERRPLDGHPRVQPRRRVRGRRLRAVVASLWSVRSCDRENVYRVTTTIMPKLRRSLEGVLESA